MNFTRKQLVLAAAIGGAVAALGTLLPWYSWSTGTGAYSMSGSWSGVDVGFKGILVLVLGIGGGAAALIVHLGKVGKFVKLDETQHLWIAAGALDLCLLLTLIQFLSGTGLGLGMGSRGIGLWLSLLGSAVGGVAAFLATRASGSSAAPKPPAA